MGLQFWALGVQGQRRRAHFQMSLGVRYACWIRLPPDICRPSPLPLPANGPTQNHEHFNLEMFSPGCVTFALTVDSLLLLSLISLDHAGPQRMTSQMNELHFTSVHLKNCPQRFPHRPQHQEKRLKFYKQISKKEQIFFTAKVYNRCFWEVVNLNSIVRNSVTPHTASIVKQLTYWWAFTFIYLDGKICLLNLSTDQHEEVEVQSKFD